MSKALEILALAIDDAGDYAEQQRIIEGFQAGLKRGAEMAKQTHENSDDLDMYNSGWDAACEEIEQVILKEANSCPEDVMSSSDSD